MYMNIFLDDFVRLGRMNYIKLLYFTCFRSNQFVKTMEIQMLFLMKGKQICSFSSEIRYLCFIC